MNIRRAEEKDIPRFLELLSQVLELHAAIRPDIFIPGTTKYSGEQLTAKIRNPEERIYSAVDENDAVMGYAFCKIVRSDSVNIIPSVTIYIDDLCVDKKFRGEGIGQALFSHVRREAETMGCFAVTLNVWEGNDGARAFYECMGMKPRSTMMEFILK